MPAPMPLVLLATPYPLLSEGIRLALLGTEIEVTTPVASREDAVRAAAAARPVAALVDSDLPGGGLAAVRDMGRVSPASAAIVLADDYTNDDVVAAVRAGAVGFLDKSIDAGSLEPAIRAAMAGEAVVPRRLVGHLITAVRGTAAPVAPRGSDALTRRELEVLQLLREGLSTSAIATRLAVAPVTVRTHVWSIRRKLHPLGDAVVAFPTSQNTSLDETSSSAVVAHLLRIS